MLTVSDGLSDHHTVIVDVTFPRTLVQSKHNVYYRPIHNIDIGAFKADILISDLTRCPKVTPEILQSKRYRRYLEQAWHKSRSSLDSSRYSKQCHYCKTQMAKAKSDYYNKIWSQIMLKIQVSYGLASIKLPAPFVPNHVSIKYICDSFSDQFKNKISVILSAFPGHTLNLVQADSLQINSLLAFYTCHS